MIPSSLQIRSTTPGVESGITLLVDTSSLVISSFNAPRINGSTFNFYDGIIKGSTSSIAGVITEIPQGYKIDTTTSEGIQTAILNTIPVLFLVLSMHFSMLEIILAERPFLFPIISKPRD